MKTIKNLERLQQLHLLIKTECTGRPKELSRKMAISERLVYTLIDQLKSLNAKVLYSRNRQTYYYCEAFQLCVSISISVGSRNETVELYDGSYFKKKKGKNNYNTILVASPLQDNQEPCYKY